MRLALYQPDIAPNAGTMLRLAACFGVGVDLIEPCGFVLADARLRRAGMDYLEAVELVRHESWNAFLASRHGRESGRLVLLTTKAECSHVEARYESNDILMVGRESAGVPEEVHQAADLRVRIPLRPGLRSINVATAAAMVLGEALRQTGGFDAWQ